MFKKKKEELRLRQINQKRQQELKIFPCKLCGKYLDKEEDDCSCGAKRSGMKISKLATAIFLSVLAPVVTGEEMFRKDIEDRENGWAKLIIGICVTVLSVYLCIVGFSLIDHYNAARGGNTNLKLDEEIVGFNEREKEKKEQENYIGKVQQNKHWNYSTGFLYYLSFFSFARTSRASYITQTSDHQGEFLATSLPYACRVENTNDTSLNFLLDAKFPECSTFSPQSTNYYNLQIDVRLSNVPGRYFTPNISTNEYEMDPDIAAMYPDLEGEVLDYWFCSGALGFPTTPLPKFIDETPNLNWQFCNNLCTRPNDLRNYTEMAIVAGGPGTPAYKCTGNPITDLNSEYCLWRNATNQANLCPGNFTLDVQTCICEKRHFFRSTGIDAGDVYSNNAIFSSGTKYRNKVSIKEFYGVFKTTERPTNNFEEIPVKVYFSGNSIEIRTTQDGSYQAIISKGKKSSVVGWSGTFYLWSYPSDWLSRSGRVEVEVFSGSNKIGSFRHNYYTVHQCYDPDCFFCWDYVVSFFCHIIPIALSLMLAFVLIVLTIIILMGKAGEYLAKVLEKIWAGLVLFFTCAAACPRTPCATWIWSKADMMYKGMTPLPQTMSESSVEDSARKRLNELSAKGINNLSYSEYKEYTNLKDDLKADLNILKENRRVATKTDFIFMFIFLGIIYSTMACSGQGLSIPVSTKNCRTKSGIQTCEVDMTLSGTIGLHDEACYTIVSEGSENEVLAKVSMTFADMYMTSNLAHLYWTSDVIAKTIQEEFCPSTIFEQNHLCNTKAECEDHDENDISLRGRWKNKVNLAWPGTTSCRSIGSTGKCRWLQVEACGYSRITYVPTGRAYRVSSLAGFQQQPQMKIKIMSTGSEDDYELDVIGGRVTDKNLTFSVIGALNTIVPKLPQSQYIVWDSYASSYAIAFASEPSAPSSNGLGWIQANHQSSLYTENLAAFRLSDELRNPNPVWSNGRVSYTIPKFSPVFTDNLPADLEDGFWNFKNDKLYVRLDDAGDLVYNVVAKGITFVRQITTVCPSVSGTVSAMGCYSCKPGAEARFTIKSTCSAGIVKISTKDPTITLSEDSLVISEEEEEVTVNFETTQQHNDFVIDVIGNGGTTSVRISFTAYEDTNVGHDNMTMTGGTANTSNIKGKNGWKRFENWLKHALSFKIGSFFKSLLTYLVIVVIALIVIGCCGLSAVAFYGKLFTSPFRMYKKMRTPKME